MKVISIVNLKGGVGKTATAINMASILATERGKSVLLIGAGPRASATRFFGGDHAPVTLYDVFTRPSSWDECCWMTQVDGVDIIPASMDLLQLDVAAATADKSLVSGFGDFMAAEFAESDYDYVLIDCPPGFTAVSIAGISVSDDIIIPAKDISLTQSLLVGFDNYFHYIRASWLSPIIAIALAFGVLAGVLTWVAGPSKGIFAVGKAGYMPPFFQKTNKLGVQKNILYVQGGAVTVLSLLFVVMPSVQSFYQILSQLTVILYLVMYLLMFSGAIYLRYNKKKTDRPFRFG